MGMHALRHGVPPLITKTRYQAGMGLRSHSEAVSTPSPLHKNPHRFHPAELPKWSFSGAAH